MESQLKLQFLSYISMRFSRRDGSATPQSVSSSSCFDSAFAFQTYETEFILEISFMSPETGIENNLLRLRRSFKSLQQLQVPLLLTFLS